MRWIKAAAALLVLAAIVVIPPWLLLSYVGNPWPSGGIRLDEPFTDDAVIGILAVAIWVVWAQVMLCLIAEAAAAITADRVQWRAPLALGVQQQLVRRLITAIMVTGVAAPVLIGGGAAVADQAPGGTSPSTVQTDQGDQAPVAVSNQEQDQAKAGEQATVRLTVERLDSLWSLAEQHLGSGERWQQIADLNKGRTMSDGRMFQASVIQPGWDLILPTPEAGAGPAIGQSAEEAQTRVIQPGDTLSQIALEELGDADAYPQLFEASRGIAQPDGTRMVDPNLIHPGWSVQIPNTQTAPEVAVPTTPQAQSQTPPKAPPAHEGLKTPADPVLPQTAPSDEQPSVSSDVEEESGWPLRTVGGIGAILAAALIALIAARRTLQSRRRRPGAQIPLPTTESETTERQLRGVADPLSIEHVDQALRALAPHGAPAMQAVRVCAEQIDLYLCAAAELPQPWTPTAEPSVWILPAQAVAALPEISEEIPSPYPALVSLGHDIDEGLLMVNLGSVGSLGLTGAQAVSAQVAITLELGTVTWAHDLVLTLVGACSELVEVLEPGRARYVPSLDQVDEVNGAHVVVSFVPLTAQQHAQLRGLGASVIHAGDSGTEQAWVLDVTDQAQAVLHPLGLELAPQLVDERTYQHLVEILEVSQHTPDLQSGSPLSVVEEPTAHGAETTTTATEAGMGSESTLTSEGNDQARDVSGDLPGEEDHQENQQHEGNQEGDVETPEESVPLVQPAAEGMGEDLPGLEPQPESVVPARASTRLHPRVQTGHPVIRILGSSVDIVGAAGPAPATETHQRICTRIAAYLAFHPGSSRNVLVEAVWNGRRIAGSTVDSRISQLRKWLGTNPATESPYLPPRTLELASELTTDWDLFTQLTGSQAPSSSTESLEEALQLVRGRPLEAEESKNWAWAEYDLLRIGGTLSDTCYELARRRYMDGSWAKASEASELGILLDPGNEYLWRLRIHAAHSAGNHAHVQQAIGRMLTRLQTELGCTPEPETLELIEAIDQHNDGALTELREAL